MALIGVVRTLRDSTVQGFWETLTEADTCAPLYLPRPGFLLGALTATGTWGGATLVLHGGIDGTVYAPLADVAGTALSLTATGGGVFVPAGWYIKPVASGGTGQDLDITALVTMMPE